MTGTAPTPLPVEYFDGRSSRAHLVQVHVAGAQLHIRGDAVDRSVPLRDVQWPERTRHGPRVAHLRGGGSLHCADGAGWDAWARGVRGESWVVRVQQSWRATLVAVAALVLIAVAGYRFGLPAAAQGVLAMVPADVDRELGLSALDTMHQRGWLRPSERAPAEQQRLREAFAAALAATHGGGVVTHEVHFRRSRFGPNALALPGGAIVVTDELVALADGDDDMLVGVLAHEYGHVRHRHGMRQLVQTTLLGVATSALFGDFSSVLATVPALLGHLDYSRDFEREADHEARQVLRASGRSTQSMVRLFDRLAEHRGGEGPPIALASHPADDERKRFFAGP